MGTLRLQAISIDELRDLFSGSAEAETRLRGVAMVAFPPPPQPAGLMSKIGPLLRRPPGAPVIRPGVPTETDLANLLAGRYIAPDRLTAAWALVHAYLAAQSFGTLELSLDDRLVDSLEFDLARAGMPAAYGLRRMFTEPWGITLHPVPGEASGFVRNAHIAAWADAWNVALPEVSDEHRETAERVAAWLGSFEGWTKTAMASGRLAPDAIATFA